MGELAKYVLSLGHKRIGMISAWTERNDRARARVMAVRHVLSESGLNASNLKLIETDYGIETGAVAFEEIMSQPRPPTVIICGNDVLAVGALRQAKKLGITVPNNVSITGFDAIELAQIVSPELTTIHVPHRHMGEMAAQCLLNIVNNKAFEHAKEINVQLKIRSSLAVPAHLQ